jgi:hypothetical protein
MLIRNKIRQRDWAEYVTDGLERREVMSVQENAWPETKAETVTEYTKRLKPSKRHYQAI